MVRSSQQLAAPDASHTQDLASYLLSCAAMLAVVFRKRDVHHKRVIEGGERSSALSQQYAEDRQWVCSDDTSDAFSFIRVCEALELDPTTTRTAFFNDSPFPVSQRCN